MTDSAVAASRTMALQREQTRSGTCSVFELSRRMGFARAVGILS